MALLYFFVVVIDTQIRLTPNLSASLSVRVCNRTSCLPSGLTKTSTSRRNPRSATSIPSAFNVASFAEKQAA